SSYAESGRTWHTHCFSVRQDWNTNQKQRRSVMAPEELTILDAQIAALDTETARRVARLVVECGAGIPLPLPAGGGSHGPRRPRASPTCPPSGRRRRASASRRSDHLSLRATEQLRGSSTRRKAGDDLPARDF